MKTRENTSCWVEELKPAENGGRLKAGGRQGTCLIPGEVTKPNGQQGGSWQEVRSYEDRKEAGCQTAEGLYCFSNLDKNNENHHLWVAIPNTGPQALIVTPSYRSPAPSLSQCKVVILGLI